MRGGSSFNGKTCSRRVWGEIPGQLTYHEPDFLTVRGVQNQCTKTKRWSARIAEPNSRSLQANKNSTQKKDSKTSQCAAKAAVKLVKQADPQRAKRAKCSRPHAPRVERRPVYLSFPRMTDRSIAANASQRAGNTRPHTNECKINNSGSFLPLFSFCPS